MKKTRGKITGICFVLLMLGLCFGKNAFSDAAAEGEGMPRPSVEYNDDGARDPFESLMPKEKLKGPGGDSAAVSEKKVLDLSKFHVQGIVSAEVNPCGLVNNKVVKIGSLIDEAKVTKIDKTGITLLYQNDTYVLPAPVTVNPALAKKSKQGGSYYEE